MDYKILLKVENKYVDHLVSIYKENKYHARVLFMNDSSANYKIDRLIRFNLPNGDFDIVYFVKSYGISKVNKMYSNESRKFTIRVRGNKFYLTHGSKIQQLSINTLRGKVPPNIFEVIINELTIDFGWVRFINEHYLFHSLTFNTIVDKRLYSYRKAISYLFGLPYLVSNVLVGYLNRHYASSTYNIQHYKEYMINLGNLHKTLPTYNYVMFYDTIKMAKTLNYKVNCSWSPTRLKLEHDKWSRGLTNIVYVQGDRGIKVNNKYVEFANFSGFELITTTKELAYEGIKNNHCVVSYLSKIEMGGSGIYRVGEYTLELGMDVFGGETLQLVQFKGYNNSKVPDEYVTMVSDKLRIFNPEDSANDDSLIINVGDELPF